MSKSPDGNHVLCQFSSRLGQQTHIWVAMFQSPMPRLVYARRSTTDAASALENLKRFLVRAQLRLYGSSVSVRPSYVAMRAEEAGLEAELQEVLSSHLVSTAPPEPLA